MLADPRMAALEAIAQLDARTKQRRHALALLELADRESGAATLSREDMCQMFEVTCYANVRRHLRQFEAAGLLTASSGRGPA